VKAEDELRKAREDPGLLDEEQQVRLPPKNAREAGSLFFRSKLLSERDGRRHAIEVAGSFLCDCGHVIGGEKTNSIVAVCLVGGEYLCGAPGCAAACCFCHLPVCAAHRRPPPLFATEGEECCSRCQWKHFLHHLFGGFR